MQNDSHHRFSSCQPYWALFLLFSFVFLIPEPTIAYSGPRLTLDNDASRLDLEVTDTPRKKVDIPIRVRRGSITHTPFRINGLEGSIEASLDDQTNEVNIKVRAKTRGQFLAQTIGGIIEWDEQANPIQTFIKLQAFAILVDKILEERGEGCSLIDTDGSGSDDAYSCSFVPGGDLVGLMFLFSAFLEPEQSTQAKSNAHTTANNDDFTFTVTLEYVDAGGNFIRETPSTITVSPGQSVNTGPALNLSQTPASQTIAQGENTTYTLTARNPGTADLEGVTVIDTLSQGLTLTNVGTPSQGTAGINNNIVTWNVGTLPAGAESTLLVTAQATATGTLTNTAHATTSDVLVANTQASATLTVIQAQPELSLTKTASPPSLTQGDTLAFTITLSNTGNATATSTIVTDALPQGLTLIAADSPSQGTTTTNANTLSWTAGDLTAGTTATLTLTARADSVGQLTNTAQATATNANTVTASATVTSTVPLVPQLALTKTASTPSLTQGDSLSFTLTLTNTGNTTATSTTVTDALPQGLTLLAAESPSQGTTTTDANTLSWTAGDLNAGATATLTLTARADSVGQLTNTAQATATNANTVTASATVTSTVPLVPQLALTKTASTPSLTQGDSLSFTLTLTNTGNTTATSTIVTDALPQGLTLIAAESPSQGTTTTNTNTLSWTTGDLTAGTTATLILTARADSVGQLTNTAQATATNATTVTASATVTSTVPLVPQLALTKTASTPSLTQGDSLSFTLTLTNTGNTTAPSATVTDALPQGLTLITADSPSQGTTTTNANTLSWTAGDLNAGATATLTLTARADSVGQLTNTAQATATNANTVTASTTVTSTVPLVPQLALSKTASATSLTQGDTLAFTLTLTNTGNTTATSTIVTDALPQGLTLLAAGTPSQGTTTTDANTLSWIAGNLDAGTTATLTLTARADSAGQLTNMAQAIATNATTVTANAAIAVAERPVLDLALTIQADSDSTAINFFEQTAITFSVAPVSSAFAAKTTTGPLTNVHISGTTEKGLRFLEVTSTLGSVSFSDSTYTVTVPLFTADQALEIMALVQGTRPGMSRYTAQLQSAFNDPILDNNTASYTVDVRPVVHYTASDSTDALDADLTDNQCATVANTCTLRAALDQINHLFATRTDLDQAILDLLSSTYAVTQPLPSIIAPIRLRSDLRNDAFTGALLDGTSCAAPCNGLVFSRNRAYIEHIQVTNFPDFGIVFEDGNEHTVIWSRLAHNTGGGLRITNSHRNTIGDVLTEDQRMIQRGNRVHDNGGPGILITSGIGNHIAYTEIFNNVGLGIDLSADNTLGVTQNDDGDIDEGPNRLQNFPTLTQATPGENSLNIVGTLATMVGQQYTLAFYANEHCNMPDAYGEGQRFLGQVDVTTDLNGLTPFNVILEEMVPLGAFVTATATDTDGNTSEFSMCIETVEAPNLTQIRVTPETLMLGRGETHTFTAMGYDQFEQAFPLTPTWSTTGGTIDATGFYTAGSELGTFTVTATDPLTGTNGQATIEVISRVSVEDSDFPTAFHLYPSFPNPFHDITTIAFDVQETVDVELNVYNLLGHEVQQLLKGVVSSGTHQVHFDASSLPAGVYVYRITMGTYTSMQSMIVLR